MVALIIVIKVVALAARTSLVKLIVVRFLLVAAIVVNRSLLRSVSSKSRRLGSKLLVAALKAGLLILWITAILIQYFILTPILFH